MENKNLKRQIVIALAPLFVLCLAVFIHSASGSFSKENNDESPSALQSLYSAGEQKSDAPSHEPVYISIFKFIINCNPFQKEAQQ